MTLFSFIKKNVYQHWLLFLVLAIVSLLALNIVSTLRNNQIIGRNYLLQKQTEEVKLRTQSILNGTMHGLDLGVRGYALTKDKALLNPYEKAIEENNAVFDSIQATAQLHGYQNLASLHLLRKHVEGYIDLSRNMVSLTTQDSTEMFGKLLKQDRGFEVWKQYVAFSEPFFKFEDAIKQQAQSEYTAAMRRNLFLQLVLMIVAVPTLIYIIYRIRKENRDRRALLMRMENTTRRICFIRATPRKCTWPAMCSKTQSRRSAKPRALSKPWRRATTRRFGRAWTRVWSS